VSELISAVLSTNASCHTQPAYIQTNERDGTHTRIHFANICNLLWEAPSSFGRNYVAETYLSMWNYTTKKRYHIYKYS